MDRYSASAAARALHATAPRVLRAIERLGWTVPRDRRGALLLTHEQVRRLGRELGTAPLPAGLSRTQAKVLAALARSPRGLVSTRSVARRAGVSPTAAARALERLTADGLVRSEHSTLAMGRATEADLRLPVVTSPRWHVIAPALSRIELPSPDQRTHAKVVPFYLRHLFWNSAPQQLRTGSSASYIARRLLSAGDPDGLAWGVTNLPPSAWESAERSRGLSGRDRALARNLASRHAA